MGSGDLGRCLVRHQSKYRQSTLATSRSRPLPSKQFTIRHNIHPTYKSPELLTASEGTQEGSLWSDLKLGRQKLNSSATVLNWGPR